MTAGEQVAALFRMDERTWQRHANPWSVWSRTTVLPLLVLAAWSRIWIGWWAICPGALALLWTWLNPRLFGRPDSLTSWASRAVLGERIWVNRDKVPIPAHHTTVPNALNVASGIGILFVVGGVIKLAIWPVVCGLTLNYAGKLWFLDRMVWLHEDMKEATPNDRNLERRSPSHAETDL